MHLAEGALTSPCGQELIQQMPAVLTLPQTSLRKHEEIGFCCTARDTKTPK